MSDLLGRDPEDINYNLPEETELPPEAEIPTERIPSDWDEEEQKVDLPEALKLDDFNDN